MENSANKKIGKEEILKLIKEEAEFVLKQKEYRTKIKNINEEIKNLYENRDFVGTFGFQGDDAQKSKSGFVAPQSISYIAQLEKEFAEADARKAKSEENTPLNEDQLNEVSKLREENKQLKSQIEEISEFISEMKSKEAGADKA